MPRYQVRDGVLLEALGDTWAAYSPASGATHLLNNEAAACLEILQEQPRSTSDVCAVLANEAGLDADELTHVIGDSWLMLEAAGLIARVPADDLV